MTLKELLPAVSNRKTPPVQCVHLKSVIKAIETQILLAYNCISTSRANALPMM